MLKMSRKDHIQFVCAFYLIFFAVDAFNVYLNSTGYFKIDNPTLAAIVGLSNRLIIWTLPVLLLLKNPLDYLKLKQNVAKGLLVGLSIGLSLLLLRVLGLYLWKGTIDLDLQLNPHLWLEVILFVGLSEEVVFRGFLLQKIEDISSFWTANIITTLLFILQHIPYWILLHKYELAQLPNLILSVLWLSLLFGFVFKKTKSLWSCIIIHSINNFMVCAVR